MWAPVLRMVVFICLCIIFVKSYNLLTTVSHGGCIETRMYQKYIHINSSNASSAKYNLFLYHESEKSFDHDEHLNEIAGVPLLFIPGSGGSYKQVRSLAAESHRAYQRGPLEPSLYDGAFIPEKGGTVVDVHSFQVPDHYSRRLDWFAVDFDDELSAFDRQIVEQQSEYVVYAIHRILDLYKESFNVRSKEGVELPRSIILVGHSMGGFVARAAIANPNLKKEMVETILTLSSPHKSPPFVSQLSLGHYYDIINEEWRRGYEGLEPTLSHVVVVSILGGIRDYQVVVYILFPFSGHGLGFYRWTARDF